jgi:ribonuclease-3
MRLPLRKDKELYSSLFRIIGLYPHNIYYYKLALLHKSLSFEAQRSESSEHEKKRSKKYGKPSTKTLNNERLEFLGDAILDAIAGDIVYRHFPGKREGFLTNTRSKIVQRDTLNRLAAEMGINDLINKSGQSQKTHNSYLGGNAFEALVGALYLDRGYDACMHFMKKRILREMINIDKVAYKVVNFKSKLIEWCQKNHIHLEFKMIEEKRIGTSSPSFVSAVVLEGIETSPSKGYTKKESQQLAAKQALDRLKCEPQFIDEVFAAKTTRTKMEEEPVGDVPDTKPQDFVIPNATVEEEKHVNVFTEEVFSETSSKSDEAAADEQVSIEVPVTNEETETEASTDTEEKVEDETEDSATETETDEEIVPDDEPSSAEPTEEEASDAVVDEKTDTDANKSDEEDEFDLSDISLKQGAAEDIIAAAEEEAYKSHG